ncbi:Coiled-coil domain-containing protein 12 [Trichostrongylus colubriformis]|uniref:Coiled-coil domain-containing protein 12 n=1 Tax=Trichostrongylus colubriformis TaxID=6319 RepID=A0AAN8F4K3_TRICO
MVEQEHSSSEEEMETEGSKMEAAALARKKRLLEMKSRLHGIEMKEDDYKEESEETKKSKMEEKTFRSYKPSSEIVGKVGEQKIKLDVVEELIASHLEDTKDVKPVETVDLSTLAPKKIDWDLKRDIEKKLQKLERKTQKCIAEMIRQRLAEGKGDLASTVNAGA